MPALTPAFYARPTLRVARDLLGKILVHESDAGVSAGRIVEVEAYRGPADRAAHTAGGRRTPRNEVMWGPGGRVYVYLVYGLHHCCNVVTRDAGTPEAVLVRALEPLIGLRLLRRRRRCGSQAPAARLCQGPGNLCRALGIDLAMNGVALVTGAVRICEAPPLRSSRLARSPRIGVDYAEEDALLPWRFYVRDSPAVSAGPKPRFLRSATR
jgi:DNA-3-methyladenine glycosylase